MLFYPSAERILLSLLVYLLAMAPCIFMHLRMMFYAKALQVGGVETQGAHIFQRSGRFNGGHMMDVNSCHHLTLSLA